MPQFDFAVATPQIVWLVLTFGLLFLMMRSMLPRVEQVTEARARAIGDDLEAAEAAKLEAAGIDAAYQADLAAARSAAMHVVDEAKTAAARETEAQMKIVGVEVDTKITAAGARIAAARSEAMTRLDAVAAEAAADIVERLTGKRPSDTDASRAVTAVAA